MKCLNVARKLDDLVMRVYHIDLSDCKDLAGFKEGLALMMRNLDALLGSLGCELPEDRRVRRAAESVKLKAARLLNLCRAVPGSFDDPEKWRATAGHIIANYEVLRIEAGHLYQLLVPESAFEVLRSAL
jgi:hypothetical protein